MGDRRAGTPVGISWGAKGALRAHLHANIPFRWPFPRPALEGRGPRPGVGADPRAWPGSAGRAPAGVGPRARRKRVGAGTWLGPGRPRGTGPSLARSRASPNLIGPRPDREDLRREEQRKQGLEEVRDWEELHGWPRGWHEAQLELWEKKRELEYAAYVASGGEVRDRERKERQRQQEEEEAKARRQQEHDAERMDQQPGPTEEELEAMLE